MARISHCRVRSVLTATVSQKSKEKDGEKNDRKKRETRTKIICPGMRILRNIANGDEIAVDNRLGKAGGVIDFFSRALNICFILTDTDIQRVNRAHLQPCYPTNRYLFFYEMDSE